MAQGNYYIEARPQVGAYCRGKGGGLIHFAVAVDDYSHESRTGAVEAVEQHLIDTKTEFYAPVLLVIPGGGVD